MNNTDRDEDSGTHSDAHGSHTSLPTALSSTSTVPVHTSGTGLSISTSPQRKPRGSGSGNGTRPTSTAESVDQTPPPSPFRLSGGGPPESPMTSMESAPAKRLYECKLCHAPNVPTPCCTTCDPVVSPEDMLDMLTECAPTHDFGDVASNVAKLEQTVRQVTWLKFNRLHKYTGLLVGKPRAWLHDTPAAKMIELGMASGATKKLKAIVDSAEHNDIPWPE
eukprot:m.86906 g.86906  ORF g.86906 m.86906 type:complete len:221 (+) comp9682_c0_seq2:2409-3071(+)